MCAAASFAPAILVQGVSSDGISAAVQMGDLQELQTLFETGSVFRSIVENVFAACMCHAAG